MTAVAGYITDNTLESTTDDTDFGPLLELVLVIGNDDKLAGLVGQDLAEIFQLIVGDDEGLIFEIIADTDTAAVETEVGKVDVVVNMGPELGFRAAGEEDIEHTRLGDLLALVVDHLECLDGGIVGLDTLADKIIVGLAFLSVGGAEGIPMGMGTLLLSIL